MTDFVWAMEDRIVEQSITPLYLPTKITEFHSNEETMSIRRLSILSLAMAGCAAAYAIGRHTRHVERQQLKKDLCAGEDEGGNLGPSSETSAIARPAAAA